MGIQFSDREENIVEKEEIASYEQFLLFPQCLQKLSVDDVLKTSIYGVKGQHFFNSLPHDPKFKRR